MISTFAFPTKIVFGPGAIERVAELAQGLGMKRPLVVTDPGIVKCGLLERLSAPLKKAGLDWTLFDQVEPNPTEASVYPGVEIYNQMRCDGIIGMGGGSPLDAAKAVRLKTTHQLPLEEYDDLRDGASRITSNLPPMIGIATTSGTGSEISRSTVIALKATDRKTVIFAPPLIPTVAIADPTLTLDLPPAITAATGMDAMTHNLEAYLATGFHPFCDAIAIKGVELIGKHLRRAVHQGKDLEARSQMMMASMMGAIAFQKGLGSTHSLAHPLSTVAGLHHGLANAILLPHVMRFNLPVARQRLKDLAAALGVDTRTMSTDEAAYTAITAVEKLRADVGIPRRLRDVGARDDMIPTMAAKAMEDGCRLNNPRPCTLQDMDALYRAAL